MPLMQTSPIPVISARVGEAFTLDLSAYFSGGTEPIFYSVVNGALPAGLNLSGSVISGTPTTSENHIITPLQIAVTDSA
jgi:hypothetical protein